MSMLRKFDAGLMAVIIATLIATVILALTSPDYFTLVFAKEDGLVEYGTALFLLIASIVMARHAASLWGQGRRGAAVLTAVYGLMFFMAAGEEISWGQRIIGWESGEFFLENNKQDETNLHNLMVGDVHLTKSLFGPVLTICILLYLVGLPLIYPKGGRIARLADRMAVPVPWLKHAAIALIASIIIAVLDADRKWEVYELIFSLLIVSIFLLPQNRDATR
ncbi:hypothetical protein SAMN05421666_0913 [Roseovarius nanhaiticus]|uniref:Uncharacterized protein n=1 Tax=Roseovarius nanhaiticus TaxID=573024 RepID=A0A1N7FBZ7_9RHOB|nr:hypothetical protein [Roseovarius nanhaiticus]SEK57789.1 hypothetical protein SAMN05216208_1223 [Roseovarius nanhaiticus]SIR97849.1 hypothetical protein SAMN05421666_0913 [Roseovarius nanhaiticus]